MAYKSTVNLQKEKEKKKERTDPHLSKHETSSLSASTVQANKRRITCDRALKETEEKKSDEEKIPSQEEVVY